MKPPLGKSHLLRSLLPLFALWPAVASAEAERPAVLEAALTPARQPVSAAIYLRLLEDPAFAERLLSKGRFVRESSGAYWVRPLVRRKPTEPSVMFRMKLEVPGKGQPRGTVMVFFKPQQSLYRDWATETAVCRLARHLAVRIAPCADRVVPQTVLAPALASVPESYRARLRWIDDGEGGKRIYGFFRVWAPGYRSRLGKLEPTAENLYKLAELLHPRHRALVAAQPLLGRLSDTALLDFLVYNNDRKSNLGAIRAAGSPPDGGLRLFPIDLGDGLSASPRRKLFCARWFRRISLFRRALVDKIRALDRPALRKLLVGVGARAAAPGGRGELDARALLVEPYHLKWLLGQRKALLAHVDRLVARHGDRAYF